MKRAFLLCFLFLLLAAQAQAVTLRLADTLNAGDPRVEAEMLFAQALSEKSGGDLTCEVYPGGTLYGTEEGMLEALRKGDIAFARLSARTLAGEIPQLRLLLLPYLFRSDAHLLGTLQGEIGQSLLDLSESGETGIISLDYYLAGTAHFALMRNPGRFSLSGRIRTDKNPVTEDLVLLLGGEPLFLGRHETFSALSQEVLRGAEETLLGALDTGDYVAAPYLFLDGHSRAPDLLVASQAVLYSLTDSQVEEILLCARDSAAREVLLMEEAEKKARQRLAAEGVQLLTVSGDMREQLLAKCLQDTEVLGDTLYARNGEGLLDAVGQVLLLGANYPWE